MRITQLQVEHTKQMRSSTLVHCGQNVNVFVGL